MLRLCLVAIIAAPLCGAFSPALPLATRTAARASGVCSLKAQADAPSRRSFLAAGLGLAAVAFPLSPVFAEEAAAPAAAPQTAASSPAVATKPTGIYPDDVATLLVSMKAATSMKKGDPAMKDTVLKARADMNEFVAFYRRNTKVAGAASFSTLYTAISTLSGHFQNYGPEYPVPAKRQKRLNQQYAEIEKQISRGR